MLPGNSKQAAHTLGYPRVGYAECLPSVLISARVESQPPPRLQLDHTKIRKSCYFFVMLKAIFAAALATTCAVTPMLADASSLIEWRVSNQSGYLIIEGYLDSAARSISGVIHCDDRYVGNEASVVEANGAFKWMLRDRECYGTVAISRVVADGEPVKLNSVSDDKKDAGDPFESIEDRPLEWRKGLQRFLNEAQHDVGNADGNMSPRTYTAMMRWCSTEDLIACEPDLINAVDVYMKQGFTLNRDGYWNPSSPASRGLDTSEVIAIQRMLGVEPDGNVGPQTMEAVKAWNRAHQIHHDYISERIIDTAKNR